MMYCNEMLPRTRHLFPGTKDAMLNTPDAKDGSTYIIVECPECHGKFQKRLTPEEVEKVLEFYWNGGAMKSGYVQDAFPDWSAADRELFLMTHVCDSCWKKMFAEPEEGGDDDN